VKAQSGQITDFKNQIIELKTNLKEYAQRNEEKDIHIQELTAKLQTF
jgi:hypothetical protein